MTGGTGSRRANWPSRLLAAPVPAGLSSGPTMNQRLSILAAPVGIALRVSGSAAHHWIDELHPRDYPPRVPREGLRPTAPGAGEDTRPYCSIATIRKVYHDH